MEILCVNYEYPPVGGGGGAAAQGLAEELVKLEQSVDVVTSGMRDLPPYESVNGVDVHRVSCWRRYRHFVTIPEMATQIRSSYSKCTELIDRNGSFAVNHTHFILPSGIVSYRLWKSRKLPYLITVHGSDVPGYNPDRFQLSHVLAMPLWRRIVRNAAALIVPSTFLKGLIEKRINGIPIEVIPYGIEFPRLPERPKLNRVLVVTRMFPRKGVQFVLQAFRELGRDWELHIAGDGPYLPELEALAAKMDLPVTFHGFVRGQKLWDLYASAKVFVFPSLAENFPVVLLEAMSAGCAVVTTDGTGCAEVVQDAALKVPPGDVEELTRALIRLTSDNALMAKYSVLGRERVASLCPQRIAETHLDVFNKYVS